MYQETEKEGKEDGTSDQEKASTKELPMEEAYGATFLCATLVGLHLVARREEEQPYAINRRALVPMVVCSLIVLANLISILAYMMSLHPPFWFLVMQIPYVFDCCFCVFVYAQSLRHSRRMMSYMAALRTLRVPVTVRTRLLMGGSVSYALILGVCTLFLVSEWFMLTAIPSVIIIYFVPSVLDLYMSCFIMTLKTHVTKLTESVRGRGSWSTEQVEAVAADWLLLKRLLCIHNKVCHSIL